jgi:hypothetical protein
MGVVPIRCVDVTTVRMLDDLAEELARNGQRPVIAHDLGQVAHVLAEVPEPDFLVAPTIPTAIVAARRGAG